MTIIMLIKTPQGTFCGKKQTSVLTGVEFYSFLGISFATPPVGNLRFQPPNDDTPKPVMVFIHGGAFSHGSGTVDKFSPDYLIDYDVILVTMNYRLHVFGFLNLGVYECPGNVGLKDQVLALKWVKKNIKSFGGDAGNVTLWGQSSGATCIYLHLLSPLSRGLFHKCIIQSPVKPQLINHAPAESTHHAAFSFGWYLGYRGYHMKGLLKFLKSIDAKRLTWGFTRFVNEIKSKHFPHAFILQPFSPSEESVQRMAFLPDPLHELVKRAHSIPMIYGMTSNEGSLCFYANSIQETINFAKKGLPFYLPTSLTFAQLDSIDLIETKVKEFYFKRRDFNEDLLPEIVNFFTDSLFDDFYQCVTFLKKSFNDNRIYMYEFEYDGNFNHFKITNMGGKGSKKITGAGHADDLCYIFYAKNYYPYPVFNEEDRGMIKTLCTLWTNFAKTGNPNEGVNLPFTWTPTSNKGAQYLKINQQFEMVTNRIREKRCQFWDKLHRETLLFPVHPNVQSYKQ